MLVGEADALIKRLSWAAWKGIANLGAKIACLASGLGLVRSQSSPNNVGELGVARPRPALRRPSKLAATWEGPPTARSLATMTASRSQA